jgi:hypothetical protein
MQAKRQWNKIFTERKINLSIYNLKIYFKSKCHNGDRIGFSTSGVLATGFVHAKRTKLDT